MSETGQFVWHELSTKDPEAAKRFYAELFGWRYKTGDLGPMPYHEFMVNDRPRGGITGLMSPAQHPAWTAYVTVDNVDAAAERAARHGGKMLMPPMDIPGTGRFTLLADPSGAIIAPFTYSVDMPERPEAPGLAGTFAWNELMTDDTAAAARFYSEVFGWTTKAMDMGPGGTYHLFGRDGKDVGGMMQRPEGVPACFWMYYVNVADVDASLDKVVALGGRRIREPMSAPGVGRFAPFMDPGGAILALFKGEAK